MPRSLGGVSLGNIQADYVSFAWFVKIEIPTGNFVYYTDRAAGDYVDASHNINGVDAVTWSAFDIRMGPIVQNQMSPLDVSYIDMQNADNVWSTYVLSTGTRFRNLQVYFAWFDPITDAFLGSMKLFDGKTDEATITGSRIRISLIPHRNPWNALVPARRYLPTCQYLFKDTSTCQYAALASPGAPTLSQIGGTLGAATYFYQVSAVGMGGETLGSTQASIAIGASHGVHIVWSAVPFAKSYNIYGRVTGGSKLKIANVLATSPLAFDDSGAITPSGALPGSNTTGIQTTCTRTQTDCQAHQNDMHFGGFVLIPPTNFKFVWGAVAVVIPPSPNIYTSLALPLAQDPPVYTPVNDRMPIVRRDGSSPPPIIT